MMVEHFRMPLDTITDISVAALRHTAALLLKFAPRNQGGTYFTIVEY
jgi:hypothetical protein